MGVTKNHLIQYLLKPLELVVDGNGFQCEVISIQNYGFYRLDN